jgi:hypothetical protein
MLLENTGEIADADCWKGDRQDKVRRRRRGWLSPRRRESGAYEMLRGTGKQAGQCHSLRPTWPDLAHCLYGSGLYLLIANTTLQGYIYVRF